MENIQNLMTGEDLNYHAENQLGISFVYEDSFLGENIRLFFSLSQLKQILPNAKYERTYFTNSWVRGFTHFRGENFSVVDLKNLFNPNTFLINDVETRFILFKEYENLRIALLGREISLINLQEQYSAIKVIPAEPEIQLIMEYKLYDLFKKSANPNLSFVAIDVERHDEAPNYLNLAHFQKYTKVYDKYFINIEKIKSYKDYTKKEEDFNILYFASSFFIDEVGILGVEVDIEKLTKYLYNTN